MVSAIVKHDITWLAPQPMWRVLGDASGHGPDALRRPSILRFANDTFMEELQGVLAESPGRLPSWVARPETWRAPMTAPAPPTASLRARPASQFEQRHQRSLGVALARRSRALTALAPAPDASKAQALTLTGPDAAADTPTFKLYQPSQQRFYLIAASVVCQQPGLPDRKIDSGKQERVGYVIRRLIRPAEDDPRTWSEDDPTTWDEHAYVMGDGAPMWEKLGPGELHDVLHLVPDEERLPLFGLAFNTDDGAARRLHAGVIPVGRREAYLGATQARRAAAGQLGADAGAAEPADLRWEVLQSDIIGPWTDVIEKAARDRAMADAPSLIEPEDDEDDDAAAAAVTDLRQASRDQIQTVSWYLLLDLAKFLETHLPALWQAILTEPNDDSVPRQLLGDVAASLLDAPLRNALAKMRGGPVGPGTTAAAAAVAAQAIEHGLENLADTPYSSTASQQQGWPSFTYVFADMATTSKDPDLVEARVAQVEDFGEALFAGLTSAVVTPDVPSVLHAAGMPDSRDAWFRIRCVYERPNCGPREPPVVSAATEPFQLASFFDPDAPARPIRIPMPLDISPAGLRKYKKNVGLVMSDLLCAQVKSVRKLTLADLVLSVLPWPFHKDLPSPSKTRPCGAGADSFGMICALSIPIVTLCALILLIIIVSLFDFIFRWLPYLFLCFPIPGLKGKKP